MSEGSLRLETEVKSVPEGITDASVPLRIFAESPGVALEGVCPFMEPFFDGVPKDARHPDHAAYEEYFAIAKNLFALTERSLAQLAVLPWDWKWLKQDPKVAEIARNSLRKNTAGGLKTLVFYFDDSEAPVRQPGTLVFRTSMLGRRRQPNEYAQPAWSQDFLTQTGNELPLRAYRPVPVVGFCGASYRQSFKIPSWYRRHFRPHRCQYERVYPRDQGLRAYALDQLKASRRIQTNIIERGAFTGGAFAGNAFNQQVFKTVREEYIRNLVECDYALCVRGGGNFSFRLYEALSLGRIPVFINTDCVLPWENLIPWRELCVWVELKDLPRIGNIVAEQHTSLNQKTFTERQRRCREVWEKHIRPAGFFSTLFRELKEGSLRAFCR
jgi:Exostosin family